MPFRELPTDATAVGRLLESAIRDMRWAPNPNSHPHWASNFVQSEVSRSAVLLLSLGNLTSDQRKALFELLSTRPGARSLGEVTDMAGRQGIGVALRLPDVGDELRVIIDPQTSDILQSSELTAPIAATAPKPPAGAPNPPPWPPVVWLLERTEVFLSTGSVAGLGDRP